MKVVLGYTKAWEACEALPLKSKTEEGASSGSSGMSGIVILRPLVHAGSENWRVAGGEVKSPCPPVSGGLGLPSVTTVTRR